MFSTVLYDIGNIILLPCGSDEKGECSPDIFVREDGKDEKGYKHFVFVSCSRCHVMTHQFLARDEEIHDRAMIAADVWNNHIQISQGNEPFTDMSEAESCQIIPSLQRK